MDAMTTWDWIVAVISLLSILLGLLRGFVRTVFALAAWVSAVIAMPLASPTAIAATGMQQQPWVIYILVFLAVFIGVRVLGGLIARALKRAGLRGADRTMGALLGAVRALVIIAIFAIAAKVSGLSESASWQLALCRPLLEGIVQWAQPYLPEKLSGIRQT